MEFSTRAGAALRSRGRSLVAEAREEIRRGEAVARSHHCGVHGVVRWSDVRRLEFAARADERGAFNATRTTQETAAARARGRVTSPHSRRHNLPHLFERRELHLGNLVEVREQPTTVRN